MPQKTLVTIVGPTAIGKTALSIYVAKHFSAPIISCDSRQFYKEIKIGTAVPSEEEQRAAKHYFIKIGLFLKITMSDNSKKMRSKNWKNYFEHTLLL